MSANLGAHTPSIEAPAQPDGGPGLRARQSWSVIVAFVVFAFHSSDAAAQQAPSTTGGADTEQVKGRSAQTGAPELNRQAEVSDTATLQVSADPEDASIFVNDELKARGRLTSELPPGTYVIRVQREGYGGLIETVNVHKGAPQDVTLRMHLRKTDPETVVISRSRGPIDRLEDSRDVWGWTAIGLGSGFFGAGIVLAIIDGDPDCFSPNPGENCSDADDTDGLAVASTAVGASLLTIGVGLLIWETIAGEVEVERKNVGIVPEFQPSVDAQSAHINVQWRF